MPRPTAHWWLRSEARAGEARTPLTPEGAAALLSAGHAVTVEEAPGRVIPTDAYRAAGADIAPAGSWVEAPDDAAILGLKELPPTPGALIHTHVFFGHAFKGQAGAEALLARFRRGGGRLLDLEYLTDPSGRRVAAFGHWAGYVGAAVALMASGGPVTELRPWLDPQAMRADVEAALGGVRPSVIVVGAKGRTGGGAVQLCAQIGIAATEWDMAETAHGGPFPQIAAHDVFLNCILAGPDTPVLFADASPPRALRVIGDIACDPTSPANPVPVYQSVTTWQAPARRVADAPPLDVVAIDNLPSLLPAESSADFAAQLLPHLLAFGNDADGVWGRAADTFARHAD